MANEVTIIGRQQATKESREWGKTMNKRKKRSVMFNFNLDKRIINGLCEMVQHIDQKQTENFTNSHK